MKGRQLREEESGTAAASPHRGASVRSAMFTLQTGKYLTWFPGSTAGVTTDAPLGFLTA